MPARRRWYERNPVVSEAMHTWQRFPRSLQRVLSQHIIKMIKKKHLTIRMSGGFNVFHVPLQKLIVIYNSRKKRRWYDYDPVVRSALNTLIFVDHGDMLRVCERIIHLRVYLDRQEITDATATVKDFEKYVVYVFSNRYLKY